MHRPCSYDRLDHVDVATYKVGYFQERRQVSRASGPRRTSGRRPRGGRAWGGNVPFQPGVGSWEGAVSQKIFGLLLLNGQFRRVLKGFINRATSHIQFLKKLEVAPVLLFPPFLFPPPLYSPLLYPFLFPFLPSFSSLRPKGSGERFSSPSGFRGGAPATNTLWMNLELTKRV